MKSQICWNCKKAYGQCSWSKSFKPVEGWEATPTKILSRDNVKKIVIETDSFEITSCPLFEDETRPVNSEFFTEVKVILNKYGYTIAVEYTDKERTAAKITIGYKKKTRTLDIKNPDIEDGSRLNYLKRRLFYKAKELYPFVTPPAFMECLKKELLELYKFTDGKGK